MAKVLFKRRTTAEIEDLEVEDGALIYNTDNGKTYMDYGEERIQTGGNADTMIAIGGEEPTDEDIKIWIKDKDNQNYNNFYYRKNDNKFEQMFLQPTGDTLPIGAITEFGGETAPTNWLFCNGQAVSRETYAELFSVIGTTYGDGDGSTTFNVPDFSSRSPMGVGTGTDGTNSETTTLGQEKGEYKHQLTVNELAKHSHNSINYNSNKWGGENTGNSELLAGTLSDSSVKAVRDTGGDQAHNTIHPVLGVNFIIKAKQSIGIVGTVSEDITDTNNNAVPNCETVKNYVDEKQTYSTEEVVIGTYLGKPLYRKVLTGTLPTGKGENSFNLPSECSIKTKYGRIKSTLGPIFELDTYYIPSNAYSISSWIAADEHTLKVDCGANYNTSSKYEITVEYTKTTD